MLWKIICYNTTVWEAPSTMPIEKAIKLFEKETGLHQMDIKIIKNLH